MKTETKRLNQYLSLKEMSQKLLHGTLPNLSGLFQTDELRIYHNFSVTTKELIVTVKRKGPTLQLNLSLRPSPNL